MTVCSSASGRASFTINKIIVFIIVFFSVIYILKMVRRATGDNGSKQQSGRKMDQKEDYMNYQGSKLTYRPGEKWNLQDATLYDNDKSIYEEYVLLNTLIDKTNALLKYSIEMINKGRIRNPDVIECITLFSQRWKGLVQRVDTRSTKDAAITIDKTDIYICLRDKENGLLHDIDTAMFVLIHEIAHMSTKNIGHTEAFWSNMRVLLLLASEAIDENGQVVLSHQDFESKPVVYCGHRITGSPDTCVKKRLCKKPF
jgi:hypothetical protein